MPNENKNKFRAPDGRAYGLTEGGIVESIGGKPVSQNDRKMLIGLGYSVIAASKKEPKNKGMKNAD